MSFHVWYSTRIVYLRRRTPTEGRERVALGIVRGGLLSERRRRRERASTSDVLRVFALCIRGMDMWRSEPLAFRKIILYS